MTEAELLDALRAARAPTVPGNDAGLTQSELAMQLYGRVTSGSLANVHRALAPMVASGALRVGRRYESDLVGIMRPKHVFRPA